MATATTTTAALDAATDPARIARGVATTLEAFAGAVELLAGYGVADLRADMLDMLDPADRAEAIAAFELVGEQAPGAEWLADVWHAWLDDTLAVEFIGRHAGRDGWTVTGAEVTVTAGGPSVWLEVDFGRETVDVCAVWGWGSTVRERTDAPALVELLADLAEAVTR